MGQPILPFDTPCSFIYRTLLWSSPSGLPRAHSLARSRNSFSPRSSFSTLCLYLFSTQLQSQPFPNDALLRSSECTWRSSTFTQAFFLYPLNSRRVWTPFSSSTLRSIPSPTASLLGHFKIPGPARAAGPIPPPCTSTARLGLEPRAAPGPSHLGRRDHEFCL